MAFAILVPAAAPAAGLVPGLAPALQGLVAGIWGGLLFNAFTATPKHNKALDAAIKDVAQPNIETAACSHGGRNHDPLQSEWDNAMDHVIDANDRYMEGDDHVTLREAISAIVHMVAYIFTGGGGEGGIDPNTPNEGIGTGYQGTSSPDYGNMGER